MIHINMHKMFEFLDRGIPKGKSLVYYVQPGVEGEIFGMQMIYNSLKSGETCVFVVSSKCPTDVRNQFKDFGFDVDSFKNRFFFVDAYSRLIGTHSKEKYVVLNPEDIHDYSKLIIELLKELPPSTILFGSLSTIMDLCGEKETIEAVKTWNKTATLQNHVIIYNFTAWPYSHETLNLIQKELFNAAISVGGIAERVIFECDFEHVRRRYRISIGGIAERVIFGQYFGIIKLDWKYNCDY